MHKNSTPLRFAINRTIQIARRGGDDREESSIEICRRKGADFQSDLPSSCPLMHGLGRLQSNHVNARAGLDEAADLGFANLAGADH